jgi:hypothetical protein
MKIIKNESPEFICFAHKLIQKWTELRVCMFCRIPQFVIRSTDDMRGNSYFWKCDLCRLKDNVKNHAKKVQTKKAKLRAVQAEQNGLE